MRRTEREMMQAEDCETDSTPPPPLCQMLQISFPDLLTHNPSVKVPVWFWFWFGFGWLVMSWLVLLLSDSFPAVLRMCVIPSRQMSM